MAIRIANAIDMHCHFGPDTIGGTLVPPEGEGPAGHASVTAVEAAQEAHASGHAALVLKSHSFASPALAANIDALVPGLRVFGGICTDYPSGGMCVEAVESALFLGARIVWLPTVHSRYDLERRKARGHASIDLPGMDVIDAEGNVLPVVHEIFDLVRQRDAVLATGHTSADEHYAVVKEFGRRGNVLVTHAGEKVAGPDLTPAQSAELADLGATIEITAQLCKDVFGFPPMTTAEVCAMLRAIGTSRCTLSTDYGWSTAVPRPVPGLQEFLDNLWAEGIPEAELETMVSANPARLLGLSL